MKVDFYILENTSSQKAQLFVCQLIEEMYQRQQQIFIHMNSLEEANHFDALLWTYRDDSFLPHQLYQPSEKMNSRTIQIGYGQESPESTDILFNMNKDIPSFHTQLQHIIEIVFADPHMQQLARERYKKYREHGYELNTIKTKA